MNKKLNILIIAIACLLASPMTFAQFPTPTYGWNLGNTLEPPCGEGCWAPPATQALINTVAASGFNTIRIPVAWDAHANRQTYVIDPAWLARVKQVVDWSLAANMTVIINAHTENGWFDGNGFRRFDSRLNSKFLNYWTQIANYFQAYDARLLLCAANEPAIDSQAKSTVLTQYYQNWVNRIRSLGGNNATRWLVVPGANTDIDRSYAWFTVPSDPAGRLVVDVHYYAPWQFCGKTGTMGSFYFWGNGYDTAVPSLLEYNATFFEEDYVASQMQKMKEKYVDNGIPVMIGEVMAVKRIEYSNLTGMELQRHLASRTYFDKTVADICRSKGIAPFRWDNGWNGKDGSAMFDHITAAVTDPDCVQALTGGAALPPP